MEEENFELTLARNIAGKGKKGREGKEYSKVKTGFLLLLNCFGLPCRSETQQHVFMWLEMIQ